MKSLRVYVASSWRNTYQPEVVTALRGAGHEVYDFRHPEPGNDGFRWSEIDPNWQSWTVEQYAASLDHPVARKAFDLDLSAVIWADLCVLVLPSGRSASWEYGYHCGSKGRPGVVYMPERCEPELMYSGSTFVSEVPSLLTAVSAYAEGRTSAAEDFHASLVRERRCDLVSQVMRRNEDVNSGSLASLQMLISTLQEEETRQRARLEERMGGILSRIDGGVMMKDDLVLVTVESKNGSVEVYVPRSEAGSLAGVTGCIVRHVETYKPEGET